VQAGGRYKFLRLLTDAPGLRARFRLTSPEGLNYHDLLLLPAADGTLQVQDVWVARTGEWLSATLRRSYGPFVAQRHANAQATLTPGETLYVQHFAELTQMQALVRDHRHREALRIFDELPAPLQQEKTTLLLRLRAAHGVGGPAFTQAVTEFRRAFPDDPALEVMLFDFYFEQGQGQRGDGPRSTTSTGRWAATPISTCNAPRSRCKAATSTAPAPARKPPRAPSRTCPTRTGCSCWRWCAAGVTTTPWPCSTP